MQLGTFIRRALLAGFATLVFSACLHERAVTFEPDAGLLSDGNAEDPRHDFLTKMGFAENSIHIMLDSLSKPGTIDTIYTIIPQFVAERVKNTGRGSINATVNVNSRNNSIELKVPDKRLGISIGFRARTVDSLIGRSRARGLAIAAEASNGRLPANLPPLAKKAHTIWDVADNLWDVKAAIETHQIRIFIQTTGPARVGPNWAAAIRSAISNWNAQAKGTSVTFVETTDPNNFDLPFRGSFGLGPDWSLVTSIILTPDAWIYPDGISLWANTGYEMNVPHNQKTTAAMAVMGMALNLGMNEYIGLQYEDGVFRHIPGTPLSEGDAWTPGSSIFTIGTTSYSTPVMTQGDLTALRTVYPTHALTSRLNNGELQIIGPDKMMQTISSNVIQFETSNDTLFFLRSDGVLFRRIGIGGTNVQLWPSSYGNPPASDFLYKNGYIALRGSTNGRIYTRHVSSGSWVVHLDGAIHYVNSGDYRIDGSTLYWRNAPQFNPGAMRIWYKSMTSTNSTISLLWNGTMGVTDYQIHNGTAVIIQQGTMYGSTDHGANWTVLHPASSGPATHVRLTEHLMGMYYYPNGYSWGSMGVRHINFHQYPVFAKYYSDPVNSIDDVSMCGARMAFLQQSAYLRIIDYADNHNVHMAYFLPSYPQVNRVKLHGVLCDYLTATAPNNLLLAKYGISNNTDFLGYTWNTVGLK